MKIVAILDTMWALRAGRAPRWFRINPRNHSGRRLIQIIGSANFVVTNACPQMVTSASAHGTPDAGWLRENLVRLDPDLTLVCGRVAQRTFSQNMLRADAKFIEMPHPAARLSSIAIGEWRERVAEIVRSP